MAARMEEVALASDPKAELLAGGAELKAELMRQAGGGLSATEAAALLGVTLRTVVERRRRCRLIAVPTERGYVYPRCQFYQNGMVPGLPDVLSAMPIKSPWMRLEWLLAPDDALGGRSPLEALRAGDRASVMSVARGHGA